MVRTFEPSLSTLVLLATTVIVAPGCGKLLGIEKAHVDPILEADETTAPEDDDEPDTVEQHETSNDQSEEAEPRHDAAAEVSTTPGDDETDEECIAFDNQRVRRLGSDGTLTPLPNVDGAAR
jgi:hypothetical protein